MPCTKDCLLPAVKYVVMVGKIMNQIWNSPLKDVVRDLLKQLGIPEDELKKMSRK